MKVLTGRLRENVPEVLLGAAVLASVLMLLSFTADLTFFADEWQMLFFRQDGISQALDPYYEHILILPTILYGVIGDLFGIDSARPNQLAAIFTFQLTGVLFFLYVRRRVGSWAALIATVLILFLGAAFEDLLLPFQIAYFGSLAAGLGALLALDRDDRTGDLVAAGLLVVSLLFSTLALPFIAGAVAEVALNPRERRRRVLVPGAAILVYVIWWAGWGHTADASSLSLAGIEGLPEYVVKAVSAGFTSIAGLASNDGSLPDQPHLIWGGLIAAIAIAAAGWRIRAVGRLERGVVITVVIAFIFYVLCGLNASEFRLPTSSRYQLPSAIFLLMIAANVLAGVKIRRLPLVVAGVLTALAINGGIGLMKDNLDARWQPSATSARASLGALDIAGTAARPDFELDLRVNPEQDRLIPIALYLETTADRGTPGFEEDELAAAAPEFRLGADSTLIDALGIELSGFPPAITSSRCTRVDDLSVVPSYEADPGTSLVIDNQGRGDLAVSLNRFSEPPGLSIGSILPLSPAGLVLPADGSNRPWQISLFGEGPVRFCASSY